MGHCLSGFGTQASAQRGMASRRKPRLIPPRVSHHRGNIWGRSWSYSECINGRMANLTAFPGAIVFPFDVHRRYESLFRFSIFRGETRTAAQRNLWSTCRIVESIRQNAHVLLLRPSFLPPFYLFSPEALSEIRKSTFLTRLGSIILNSPLVRKVDSAGRGSGEQGAKAVALYRAPFAKRSVLHRPS